MINVNKSRHVARKKMTTSMQISPTFHPFFDTRNRKKGGTLLLKEGDSSWKLFLVYIYDFLVAISLFTFYTLFASYVSSPLRCCGL